MGFGFRCYSRFWRITFAANLLLFGMASTFAQNAFAKDAKPEQTVVVRARRLFDPATGRMLDRPVIVIVGNKINSVSSGTYEATFADRVSAARVATMCAEKGIGVRDGNMYSPRLLRRLGVSPETGAVRASLVHYNTIDEIDRFVDVLRRIPHN